MTKQEAQDAIDGYIADLDKEEITLRINEEEMTVTAGQLGLKLSNGEILDEALSLGKAGNIVQRYKALKDLEHEKKVYELRVEPDEQSVKTLVEEECTKFNVNAENAGLEKNGSTFQVIPGKTGLKVDVDTSVDLIMDYISNEWDHGAGQLELAVEVDEPKGTAEQLGRVKDLLGTFSTSFPNSSSDRVTNVSCHSTSECLLFTYKAKRYAELGW